jgi:YVTN family beta-propeller protein
MNTTAKNWLSLVRSVHWTSILVLGVICSVVRSGMAQEPSGNGINTDASPPKNTVVANITVGTAATFGVVSPDSNTLYVASELGNTVSVIDATTNTVTSVIPVGSIPVGLALTPDGTALYVANVGDGTVSVIDTATSAVTATLKIGNVTSLPAANPNGKSIYVPFASGIQIIDTSTKQLAGTVPVTDAQPIQVLFNRDGTYAYAVCDVSESSQGTAIGGVLQINTSSLVTTQYLWNKLPQVGNAVANPRQNTLLIGELIQKGPGLGHTTLAVFDTVTGTEAGKIPFRSYDGDVLGIPTITPNGAYAYVPLVPDIIIVDTAANKAVGEPIPIPEASFVAIAPNGKYAYASTGANFGSPNRHSVVFVIAIGPK